MVPASTSSISVAVMLPSGFCTAWILTVSPTRMVFLNSVLLVMIKVIPLNFSVSPPRKSTIPVNSWVMEVSPASGVELAPGSSVDEITTSAVEVNAGVEVGSAWTTSAVAWAGSKTSTRFATTLPSAWTVALTFTWSPGANVPSNRVLASTFTTFPPILQESAEIASTCPANSTLTLCPSPLALTSTVGLVPAAPQAASK